MTEAERLAAFVTRVTYDDLSESTRSALKIRILDSLGCAIGALRGPPIRSLRTYVDTFGGRPLATIIGAGQTAPDRACLYNSALVRYLDFNDSYLAKGETCHPSDNLGAVLAAGEYAGVNGKELLTALAVAYQVQCQLSAAAPVRAKGFDHTTQGAYAVAAGVSKVLGLTANQSANAIAIAGAAHNGLRVTRTGRLSQWKGLAYPHMASSVLQASFLAMNGVTGPLDVFEGDQGFKDTVAGPFIVDWAYMDLDAVRRTIIKKYNAEIHAQSALEGIIQLRESHHLDPASVERIELDIFDVAYDIIGGTVDEAPQSVHTKEQADHSLPYMMAVAMLDGAVGPPQYEPQRIARDDVQTLLKKVVVRPDAPLSQRFPDEVPVNIRMVLRDGRSVDLRKADYDGFLTRPMSWEQIAAKFDDLAAPYADPNLRQETITAVESLDSLEVSEMTALLGRVDSEGL
jgi:2-methylcitrate dehydratase